MKKLLCFIAFVCLLATTAQAQGWSELANTKIRPVCWDSANNTGCVNVVAAWNSAVMDTLRNRLIVWGGGHGDYYGNEIYAINLNGTPTAERLNDPTAGGCSLESCDGGLTPNSRHTYDGIEYMPNSDRMFVFGGALAGNGFAGRDTWTFRFSDKTWHRMNPSGPLPNATCCVTTGYDSNTGKVFLVDLSNLYVYDFAADTYQLLGSASGTVNYHATGVVDPIRRKFVILGGGEASFYDISGGGSYNRQAMAITGCTTVWDDADYPGLAYDPVSDRIIAWIGGDTVYSLNLDTRVCTPITQYTGGPGAAQMWGTYGRWSYSAPMNAFVLVNSIDQNTYSFRLNGGTPPPTDTQAPTVTLTAPSSGAVLSGSVNLTATASDNVGVAGVQFFVDGANAGSEDTVSPYLVAWDSNSVSNGSHAIAARARDAAGNTTTTPAITITTSNTAPPPPSGLIVAYAFDETSGTVAADASGNNNAATVQGSPVWTDGKYGNALSFNGTSSVLQNAAFSYTASPLTLSLWAKLSALPAGWQDLVKNGYGYGLHTYGSNGESHWSGAGYHFTSQTLSAGTWYHLASVLHPSGVQIYLDGVKVLDEADSNGLSTVSRIVVGSGVTGIIDNVRVYNRALTPAEILSDMNTPIGGSPPPPPPSGPLTVGPGKQFATVCAAVAAAPAGGTIEADAGIYPNESCVISQNALTLRGIGGRAHLKWATGDHTTHTSNIPNGKGILNITAGGVVLENLEFSGAKVADGNGSGVRYSDGGNLTIRNGYFHNNESGLLGQGGLSATLLVEYSIFEANGYCPGGGGCNHNVYIGEMGRLIFQHNKSTNSVEGHTLKSRAHINEILYNFLSTKNSDGSYEIDLPNGGTAFVKGNVIEQGANTGNSTLLGWGAEGATNPNPELRVINNTFYNWRPAGATFVQVSGSVALSIKNNIFAGGGVQLVGGATDLISNKTSASFVNAAAADFHLTSSSDAINAGVPPGTSGSYDLTPVWEYVEPAARVARTLTGTIDVGAYESNFAPPPPPPSDPCVSFPYNPTVSAWPNTTGSTQGRWNANGRQWVTAAFKDNPMRFESTSTNGCTVTVTKP